MMKPWQRIAVPGKAVGCSGARTASWGGVGVTAGRSGEVVEVGRCQQPQVGVVGAACWAAAVAVAARWLVDWWCWW